MVINTNGADDPDVLKLCTAIQSEFSAWEERSVEMRKSLDPGLSIDDGVQWIVENFWPVVNKQLRMSPKVESLILSPAEFNERIEAIEEQRPILEAYDSKSSVPKGYWLFYCNPGVWDAISALKQDQLSRWQVNQHKQKIKAGDRFVLYIGAPVNGLFAIGTIASDPADKVDDSNAFRYAKGDYNPNEIKTRVDLQIDHNLVSNPLFKEQLLSNHSLRDLPIGRQGTNFSITESQFAEILKMVDVDSSSYWIQGKHYWIASALWGNEDKTEEFISEGVWLNQHEDGNRELVIKVKVGDQIAIRANTTRRDRDSLPFENHGKAVACMEIKAIGTVIANPADGLSLEVQWDHDFQPKVLYSYRYVRAFSVISPNSSFAQRLVAEIFFGAEQDMNALEDYYLKRSDPFSEEPGLMHQGTKPMNRIYFGPPGTGKTYGILKDLVPDYEDSESQSTNDQELDDFILSLPWWKVIAATFVEQKRPLKVNEILNHQFFQTKLAASSNNNPNQLIWALLQAHTPKECETVNYNRSTAPFIFWKDDGSVWRLLGDQAMEDVPELGKLATYLKPHSQSGTNKRWTLLTFHQSYSYEDFVEGIRPNLSDDGEADVQYNLEKGLFYRACLKALKLAGYDSMAQALQDTAENRRETFASAQPYLIIMDEINRANISKVFGELIATIEADKRLGSQHELIVELPYSKERFGVPANLHIIGTMNSADRSIALMDLALRRRFEFVEKAPDPTQLSETVEGVDLQALLTRINERIEVLYDKEHCIGHSYFLKVHSMDDLARVFVHELIPLLQEYFFDDWRKIQMVLGDGDGSNREIDFIHSDSDAYTRLFPQWQGSGAQSTVYTLNHGALYLPASYQKIYS